MEQYTSLDPYAPVGVFDSGVGGLTVAREIMRQLPEERLVYFGDTARVPYGSKSQATILRFVRQIVRFLETKEVKAIVVACNTASAYALETIEKEIQLPIIGVVKPGAKTAAAASRNGRIGVIATDATIGSGLYTQFIRSINPKLQVFGKACPLFCPLVEEGWLKDPVTVEVANRYLEPLLATGIDTLVMGCTHYPLLRSTLREIMGDKVNLVNPAYETARELKALLEEGLTHDFVTEEIAKRYLKELQEKDIDTLILGCTHYPLLRSLIRGIMGDQVQLVNPAYETALGLRRLLQEHHILSDKMPEGATRYQFYVSDGAEKFREFANSILPHEIRATHVVDIENY